MKIKLNLQIFIFAIVFLLTKQIHIYSIVLILALLHECGHLIIGIILKLKPQEISINPFGLSIVFQSNKNYSNLKTIIVALAGPLTNIFLIVLTSFFNINNDLKEMIVYSNIAIAWFNLLPIYPLDGGRILKAILKCKEKETIIIDRYINKISNITVIIITGIFSIIILILQNIAVLFIIGYLWVIIIKENKRYRLKKSIYDIIAINKKQNSFSEATNEKK